MVINMYLTNCFFIYKESVFFSNKHLFEKTFTIKIPYVILCITMIEGDDMQILKGYVFRLYPNKEQAELINKTIGCSRFIYNYFLDDKIKEYKIAGKSKSAYEQIN